MSGCRNDIKKNIEKYTNIALGENRTGAQARLQCELRVLRFPQGLTRNAPPITTAPWKMRRTMFDDVSCFILLVNDLMLDKALNLLESHIHLT